LLDIQNAGTFGVLRRYVLVIAGVLALGAVGITLGVPGRSVTRASADSAAPITFSTPTIVDPIHPFGEPTISFNDPTGEVYASGPTGTGTQRSEWEGSFDGGQTFRVITPNAPPTAVQSTEDPPGGGDTDLNFDHTGKEYFLDLYALACVRSATTSDGGATVNQGPAACGQSAGADRQWLAAWDPPAGTPNAPSAPLIYDEFNNLNGPGPNSGGQWNRSTDGINWTNATNGDQSGATLVTPATEAVYSPFGPDGYPAIDQQTGKVFQAAAFPNGCAGTENGKYDLDLNIGTPDSNRNLTFLDAPATPGGGPDCTKLITIAKGLPGNPDTLFSVLSMDSARNLYVTYAVNTTTSPAQDQVYVSASSAASGWKTWTAPVQVSDGSTSTGDAVNLFPWIKAGGPGRADAVWYGSDKAVDPSSQSGQSWNVFMNQVVFPTDSTGAITGAAPTTSLVKVSPHPMHYNDVCLQGSGCITSQGNRNLADFFSVTIDSSGAAEVIYNDTSNGLAQQGFTPSGNQTVDHAGAALVTIARQASGMGLFGAPVTGGSNAPAPSGGMSDPSGDAKYPVIRGGNVPGADLLGTTLSLSADEKTLTVTNKVVDLSNPSATAASISGTQLLQYVTRWQMGNSLYYAAMSTSSSGSPTFYAGKTQSVDLCSVSACDPHVLTYPESSFGGSAEGGKVSCPAKPSASNPCTITINVAAGDVGNPTDASLLEETGTYAFAASHPQGATTNAQAQADNVPLQIDGTCCFNFQARAVSAASVANPVGSSAGERFGRGGGTLSKGGSRCPRVSGRLSGKRLGPLSLGITRAHARHTLRRFVVTRYGFDDFCLRNGWGIRVGYSSPRLSRTLPRRIRRALAGRAVEILTANRFYALDGIRPGAKLKPRTLLRLHALKYYAIGMNDWYLVPGRAADGVLKVRYHRVLEVGVADKRAAFGRKGPVRFFDSFRRG
jgi:hypothetical protein